MSQKASPGLIGAFVVGAVVLTLIAVVLLASGSLFQRRDTAVMFFEGSVYGLQVGSPVVFLGVKVGQVKSISIGLVPEGRKFVIPVEVEFDPRAERQLEKVSGFEYNTENVRKLGLRAQLQSQSLLTGQLMIELSIKPNSPERVFGLRPNITEIPTLTSRFDQLSARLEQIPIEDLMADLSSAIASFKATLSSPALREGIEGLAPTMKGARQSLNKLNLALDEMNRQHVMAQAGQSFKSMQEAANRTGDAMDKFRALSEENSATQQSLRAGITEIGAAARSIRQLTARDSDTVWQLEQTARELEQTSLGLRNLSESLAQRPEQLIWGRKLNSTTPGNAPQPQVQVQP